MKLAVTYMNDIDVHTLKTAGADAVILGIERFSMRMASPIPLDALADTVRAIHAQHLECWVTMNAPIHEADLDAMEAALKQVLDAGVDNVLFADLAVLAAAGPDKKRLIYHPETYATDVGDNRFYANEGIAGIVAGRELTIDAIEAMAEGPLASSPAGNSPSTRLKQWQKAPYRFWSLVMDIARCFIQGGHWLSTISNTPVTPMPTSSRQKRP